MMVEQIATVVSTEQEGVWLTTTPVTSCNACHVSNECGTGIVTKTLTRNTQHFFVRTQMSLLPGEQVLLALAERNLLLAAVVVYLLPLSLLVLFTLIAHELHLAEIWQVLSALFGAAVGFALARRYDLQQSNTDRMQIMQVLPSLSVTSDRNHT